MKKIIKSLLLILFIPTLFSGAIPENQQKMLNDLNLIKNEFELSYAPNFWKQECFSWNLEMEVENIQNEICRNEHFTPQNYQQAVKNLFVSTKDVHAGVDFYSTEYAALPFLVQGVNGRYFVVWCNETYLQAIGVPINCGDEILSFNAVPVNSIIEDILTTSYGGYASETFCRLSQLKLTLREGGADEKVPQGKVKIEFIKNDVLQNATLSWMYLPEKIELHAEFPLQLLKKNKINPFHKRNRKLNSFVKAINYGNQYASKVMGSKKNIFPALGNKLWEPSSGKFDAYIFKAKRKKIGYIRIADFDGDAEHVSEFEEIIKVMKNNSDALVVDVMNNPGGVGFYTLALLSMLSSTPLKNLNERSLITQREVYTAAQDVKYFESIPDDKAAQELLGDDICGYAVDRKLANDVYEQAQFILNEYKNRRFLTEQYPLEGIAYITPHKRVSYDKDLYVLTNALSISCADFFPAILQDNKRAIIVGTTTAGAGGCTVAKKITNRFAIADMHFTNSMIYRLDGTPLENRGVVPDIEYILTEDDYSKGYKGFLSFMQNLFEIY